MGIKVADVKTNQIFQIDTLHDTVNLRCKDGVLVRLHPNVVITMVKVREQFDGHTRTGTRRLKRVA